MNRAVLFTGAGVGVPLGLPTTTDFSAGIQAGAQPVTTQTLAYLGDTSRDLELILATLEAFSRHVAFTEFLLKQFVGSNRTHAPIYNQLVQYKTQAAAEVRRIKKIIWDRLEHYDRPTAATFYYNLLAEFRTCFPEHAISIFITNYDLTFDYAVQSPDSHWSDLGINDFYFGFKAHLGLSVYDPTIADPPGPDVVEVMKLHGSLDWHRDLEGRCTRAGSATVPDDPDTMPILYPGYKEVPQVEPFATLHGRLHQRLMAATNVFVVGFAFRDAYINNTFDNVLRARKDLPVYCFNPLDPSECPEESRLPYFLRTYRNFKHLKHGASLGDVPLNLREKLAAT